MIDNAEQNIRQGHYNWLVKKKVPDTLAALMVARMDANDQPTMNHSTSDWLYAAFDWENTSEGTDFWIEIADNLTD